MNHPEHREQKRDDPDSFFLFASDSLSFSLSLSRNSCKITICTVYTHFFSLRLSRTHTLEHPSALKNLHSQSSNTLSTADLPQYTRVLLQQGYCAKPPNNFAASRQI